MKKIKEQIKYICYRIGSVYREARCYIKHNILKKTFWKLISASFHSYPWDYSFIYSIEEAHLKHMLQYYENSHIVCEESRQHMIKTLKLAIQMLYIIQHETDYFDYEGDFIEKELDKKDENGEPLYELDGSDLKYIQKCTVNVRNYKRFNISESSLKIAPHALYMAKAHYLYHKIRQAYEEEWWD